ncbi:MAG: DUF3854 domain-containing protein [Clostridiales Family XIII bacterium]|nr:DUF3854 domain-containing protein [Clostridiales Family XIII bacterium]
MEGGPVWPTQSHIRKAKAANAIIVTEGVTKAEAIHFCFVVATIGLPGVNNYNGLLNALETVGTDPDTDIHLMFDMDMYENDNVFKAALATLKKIEESAIPYRRLTMTSLGSEKLFKGGFMREP